MGKYKEGDNYYFKSEYSDIGDFKNLNIASYVIDIIKNKEDEVMLTDEDFNKITSYEIVERTQKVAKGFNLLGLKKNDIIGFVLPNMIEFSYCMLGGLLSGGIISPINPVSTIEEIKNTLSNLSPKFLVIDYSNYYRIKDDLNYIFGDHLQSVIVINDHYNQSIENLELPINIDKSSFKVLDFQVLLKNDGIFNQELSIVNKSGDNDVSFILYSSGTTGNFKGVCLTHENSLSNINQVIQSKYKLYKDKQNFITSLPFFHTFGLHEILLCILCFGGGFIFLKKYNLEKFLTLIQNEKATVALIVPPIGVDLAKSPLVDQFNCSSLKLLYSGAAPFPRDVIDEIKKRVGTSINTETGEIEENLKIFQGYGLTECVGFCTVSNPYNFKEGSSGLIISNMIAKVVDIDTGKSLDINQVGELCFKGPSVMKGYFNNIKATNETFDNEGFLKTGDIGYFDEDGEVFIIDRKKELIKSYGNQVAPAELENILLTHPKIKDACVVGVSSEKGIEVPRAFVVLKQNESISENDIHQWLNPKVSHYKYLRGGIFFIDQIPKSPSGKILRRKLRDQK